MLVSWMLTAALAATPEQVLQRVDEVRADRTRRLDHDAPSIDRAVYGRAASGEVVAGTLAVEGHKAKKVWGVAVFDVPIGRYWAAINDDASKVKYTKLAHAEVVAGKPCTTPRRVFQFATVPIITDRWWVVAIDENRALAAATGGRVREQVWKTNGTFETPTATTQAWSEKGIPITSTQGSWLLVDLDGRSTLVEYYTWADPGGYIPANLASSLAASGVDDTLQRMADMAKDGPLCPVQ